MNHVQMIETGQTARVYGPDHRLRHAVPIRLREGRPMVRLRDGGAWVGVDTIRDYGVRVDVIAPARVVMHADRY